MKRLIPFLLLSFPAFAGNITSGIFDTNLYGFIKASAMYADQAVSSYNNINMSAPTNATPTTRFQDERARLSFQTQQTRFGMVMKKETNLEGKLEFDFIDFNKSSPTTQMSPRVRIASITYHLDEKNKLIVGQDWDLFSPTNTYTFDIVGLYFLAGNTGFMRQQAQLIHTEGQWEYGAALGMAGNNPGVTDSDLEFGQTPSYSSRINYNMGAGSRVGLSGIYSSVNYYTTNQTRHDSYGANAFYEQVFAEISIKSELYYGQNLANIGALSIGKGTQNKKVKEYGGFFTATKKITENKNLIFGAGFAHVDNKQAVTPYTLSSTGTITYSGIVQNNIVRAAYELKLTPYVSWMTETTNFNTTNKISASSIKTENAQTIETGILMRF